ncbi:metallophosphoesterase family protein [Tepidibacter hydrothermalis]|uniref:Phosphoesterase n=1 Tax=Tepidibacter hydrothermalis TaxID=3036126 RepID=A0ABY8EDJ8_9FIRM|nr:metallophosphoesterase [Tepidibacter hydrothermalis]WFD11015.1 metallophosphoesterase [Tepidibacter hydrothermalis]
MKIGVIGDTHRNYKYIDKAIQYLKECELILHTGDNFQDSNYIHKVTGIDTVGIKGNCDFENVEDEIVFDVKGYRIFLCHGHKYDIKYSLKTIKRKALESNVDIVIFGHSHIPVNYKEDDILFLNPGSVALPRGNSSRQFIIMNIDSKVDIQNIIL